MGESKFARLTAAMLVRKGEASPSEIQHPRRRKSDPPSLSIVSSNPLPAEKPRAHQKADQTTVPSDDTDLLFPYGVFERALAQSAPKKQHRIMIVLTDEEYETLGILAVKKGFTRHQVLRKVFDGYLAWLIDEYGTKCRCISSTCSKECDHSSTAELSERPTDVE